MRKADAGAEPVKHRCSGREYRKDGEKRIRLMPLVMDEGSGETGR